MPSAVGGDLSNIRTGPSHITYNAVDVGHTMDGVEFGAEPNYRDRKVDEYGENVADAIHQGDEVTVKTKLAETTLAILQLAFQFGAQLVSPADTQGIGKLPGTKASSLAKVLRLHPLDVVGTQQDIVLHKAYVSGVSPIQVGTVTEDTVYEVTFRGLIDESKDDGQMIAEIGGPTP